MLMARLAITDLTDHIPLDIYDANGMRVRRKVFAFDPETGVVESFVLDRNGMVTTDEVLEDFVRRTETYPAPLAWKSISDEEVKRYKRDYLDLKGE